MRSHLCPGGRFCSGCNSVKPLSEFFNWKNHRRFKACTNTENRASSHRNKAAVRITQRAYEQRVQERARNGDRELHSKMLVSSARVRARRFNVPFSITWRDVPVPERCPALGLALKLNRGKMGPDSATIDRIVPRLGYVPGNVVVVSLKANLIKTDATAADILRVGMFYANITTTEIAV